MPTYDYKCIVCDNVTTIRDVLYEHRMTQRLCSECSGTQTYVFPLEAGIVVHESHFDEGLGCDIGGDRERKQVMKALGLEEAGDAVGGARNEEGKGEGIYAPQGIKDGFDHCKRRNRNTTSGSGSFNGSPKSSTARK